MVIFWSAGSVLSSATIVCKCGGSGSLVQALVRAPFVVVVSAESAWVTTGGLLRTRRTMIVILADARCEVHHNIVAFDPLFLLRLTQEVAQLAMRRKPAASPARD